MKGKVTPALSAPIDIANNRDYFGGKIRTGSFPENILRTIWFAANNVLPLALAEPSEAVRRGEVQPTDVAALAERGGAQFLGVDLRETSPWEYFRWERDNAAHEQFGKPYAQLNQIEKAQIDALPDVQAAQERLRELPGRDDIVSRGWDELDVFRQTQREEQLDDDAAFSAGTMDADVWRSNYADREARFFAKREAIAEFAGLEFQPEDTDVETIDAAIRAYFEVKYENYVDPETGHTDWIAFNDAQDEALAPLSEADRRKFEELVLGKHDTPMEARYREARRLRRELGDIPQFRAISVEQKREADDFLRRVRAARDAVKRRLGPDDPRVPTMDTAIQALAQAENRDDTIAFVLFVICFFTDSGSSV